MRLLVQCEVNRATQCPVNYNHLLTAQVYRLLETSDADYSRFLHDEGYQVDDGPKRFKLFVFSWLRGRMDVTGDTIRFAPGPLDWYLASPLEPFLTHCATGLLATGALQVGTASLPIAQVQALPTPDFSSGEAHFSCLSPIVASIRKEEGGTHYLRPTEGPAFSEAVRCNLIRKYETIYGQPPADTRFQLTFDPAYLERDRNHGQKKVTYKAIDIVGAYCPFKASGSPDLLQTMWQCGAGEKNAGGFGMVDRK